ncbi:MAG: hypothetical protein CM1200mP2_49730 [Planctomycetaceae bacterium]|nr:MAG: hypothetical protein CM1200mP2_49730 [Planctomycetaceae bacterium]
MDLDRDKLLWIYRGNATDPRIREPVHEDFAPGLIPGSFTSTPEKKRLPSGCGPPGRRRLHHQHPPRPGALIAKGVEIKGMMAEIRGKAAGCCKGKGARCTSPMSIAACSVPTASSVGSAIGLRRRALGPYPGFAPGHRLLLR